MKLLIDISKYITMKTTRSLSTRRNIYTDKSPRKLHYNVILQSIRNPTLVATSSNGPRQKPNKSTHLVRKIILYELRLTALVKISRLKQKLTPPNPANGPPCLAIFPSIQAHISTTSSASVLESVGDAAVWFLPNASMCSQCFRKSFNIRYCRTNPPPP